MTIDSKIKKWIGSLSGFQGGNPNAVIWFCGIEFQQFNKDFDEALKHNKYWTVDNPPYIEVLDDSHLKEPFNISMIKLAETYFERNFTQEEIRNIFSRKSNIFKMNLYPLPQVRSGEDYPKEISDLVKIQNKEKLREICEEEGNRFDLFKRLLDEHKTNVKAIICCSRMNLETYVKAFEMSEKVEETLKKLEVRHRINEKNKYLSHCKLSNGINLFVIPFLSGHPRYTLTSKDFADIIWIGNEIKEIVKKNS